MMNLQQSHTSVYSRQLAATLLIQQTGMYIQAALQLRREDVRELGNKKTVGGFTLWPILYEFFAYLEIRDALFPESPNLFPSITGEALLPAKFNKAPRQWLEKASVDQTPTHPCKLSESQLNGLKVLRFKMERSGYQCTLAIALSVHLALRPSEVAKLQKKDSDFDDRKMAACNQVSGLSGFVSHGRSMNSAAALPGASPQGRGLPVHQFGWQPLGSARCACHCPSVGCAKGVGHHYHTASLTPNRSQTVDPAWDGRHNDRLIAAPQR